MVRNCPRLTAATKTGSPFPTSCVCLELRPLPSTGVTRLPRCCEPLRHPRAPGLSLAGVRLAIPDHVVGPPVLRTLSLCTCCRHYPGAASGRMVWLGNPAVSAFPGRVTGSACTSSFSRLARRLLALRPAHSRGHQFVTAIRRLQPFRYLHDCSDCFRRERIAGWALHPLENAAFSRRTPEADISAVQSGRSAKPGGCGSVCFRPIVKPHRNRSWNKRPSAGLSASFKPASKLENRSPSAPSEQTEVDRR